MLELTTLSLPRGGEFFFPQIPASMGHHRGEHSLDGNRNRVGEQKQQHQDQVAPAAVAAQQQEEEVEDEEEEVLELVIDEEDPIYQESQEIAGKEEGLARAGSPKNKPRSPLRRRWTHPAQEPRREGRSSRRSLWEQQQRQVLRKSYF